VGVALVAQGVAQHADVVGTAQSDVGQRAHLVDDLVQRLRVVVEDVHQPEGDKGQRALVGGPELVFAIRVRCGYQDFLEILLHHGRVVLRPAAPCAAQDIGAAHEHVGVVAQVKHRLAAGELDLGGGPSPEDRAGLPWVVLIAGEVPHPREIPDRDHVVAPCPEIHIGSAAHRRVGPRHDAGVYSAWLP
jgi:hypothetical protein